MKVLNDNPKIVEEKYGIMLPCSPNEFGSFISNLLGKPQTIEKFFKGLFCINNDDIVNTFHLIDQRIHQQNEASLTQFTVKIFFNDDSSVLINSLSEFKIYNEVRPLKTVGVTLSWNYLIKFQQKEAPEKQQIDLSFRSGTGSREIFLEDGLISTKGRRWHGPGRIFLRISHTERTWGLDIESLISGHIKNLTTDPDDSKDFASKHSGKIGLAVGLLLFVGALLGSLITMSKFIKSYNSAVSALGNNLTGNEEILVQKIDFLINIITTGAWPRFLLSVVAFIVVSFIISIFCGAWVGSKADRRPESFVLLSKASTDYREKILKKQKRDWLMFGLSLAASIVAGIISNVIFNHYFGSL